MCFQKIPETNQLQANEFFNEVIPAGKPLVIRGLVKDWPLVKAGIKSPFDFCNYLMRFDQGQNFNTVYGPASVRGRIFYNQDMSGLNCQSEQKKLAASLQFLLNNLQTSPAPTLAIQSVILDQHLPGLTNENQLALLANKASPRLWIGNKTIVAAHYDASDNIACCVAGKRIFTVFPPDQVKNLYVGPFEFTPSGVSVSMVDFDNPDYEKFPDFKVAENNGFQAELHPGDAIYIPYLWWHHVRALSELNALVNYWWNESPPVFGAPGNALQHTLLSLKNASPTQKQAWKALFDYYIFNENPSAIAYIPEERQGILGKLKTETVQAFKNGLIKALNKIN